MLHFTVAKRTKTGRLVKSKGSEPLFDEVVIVTNPKAQKNAKNKPTKRTAPPSAHSPSLKDDDNEECVEDEASTRAKRSDVPVDVSQCHFDICCITKFSDKDLVPDIKTVKLGEFKVHDYNTKATKAVHKHAEKIKAGFELEEAIATIKGLRLAKLSKEIEDPSD